MRHSIHKDLHFSASPIMFWASAPYINDTFSGTPVTMTFHTDPLCPWSWAMEPVLYKFLQTYGQRVSLRFKMAGILSATTHADETIKTPRAIPTLLEICRHITRQTGVAINPRVWEKNKPVTPFTACTAFKCADRQGEKTGALYLSLLRLAAMGQGKDISNSTVLHSIAQTVSAICPEFDYDQFAGEMENGSGYLAMEEDFRQSLVQNIESMPCIVMQRNGQSIRLNGYTSLDRLAEAMCLLLENGDENDKSKKGARSVYLRYR